MTAEYQCCGRLANLHNYSGLESEPQSQLSYARVNSRATDHAEGRRREICVGARKLGVVECIEELGTELNAAFLDRPSEHYGLG